MNEGDGKGSVIEERNVDSSQKWDKDEVKEKEFITLAPREDC